MTREEIFSYVWQVLALLGGAGVVAAAVAAFVAKFFADRSIETHKATLNQETERLKAELGKDAETHKWLLKKKEILLQREFEAADEFFELRRRVEPRFRHPDMEWSEAAEDVVEQFSKTEDALGKYIAKHAAVLSAANRSALDECRGIASNNQFAAIHGGVGREEEDLVKKFLNLLGEIEKRFVEELRA